MLILILLAAWAFVVLKTGDPRLDYLAEMERAGRSAEEILDAALRMEV